MTQTTAHSRPNLVLFMPDQLRADAVGCFGNAQASTPHMDALAARGTRFGQAFGQNPVCGPSRVSIMTGWYPHTAGHRTLDHLLRPDEPNMMRMLKDAGYYVAIAGNRGDVFAPGVTEASSDFCGHLTEPDPTAMGLAYTPDHPEPHPLFQAMHFGAAGPSGEPYVDNDEAKIRTAEQWIAEGAPSDRPWVLWVPLIYPHPPFTAPEPWFSMHDRSAMPKPIPRSARAGGPGFRDVYSDAYGWDAVTDDHFAEIIATYYGMISRVDDQLGRLVTAVDRIGQADRTGWVVCPDHGEYAGDYGLVEKWPSGMEPQLVQNPLIVSMPGMAQGQVCDELVELVDLIPTFAELAETELQHTQFGQSLVPALRQGGDFAGKPAVFTEGGFRSDFHHSPPGGSWIYDGKKRAQYEHPTLVGLAQCVRTERWSFVHRAYEDDELYDRVVDPYETTNLLATAPTPEMQTAASQMRSLLLDWFVETSDVIPWERDPRFPEIPHGWRNG